MAGVFESYVDLEPEEVGEAILRCYCSFFSDRALDALHRSGIDPGKAGMAVVVQRFVSGAPSGVLFSVDPVRGDEAVMQLNAVDGWCREAVFGGLPKARCTLDKSTGTCTEQQIPTGAPHLSSSFLTEPADGARRIESVLGVPVDVEWTSLGGAPVYLQARPLTGLRSRGFPISWERPEDASFCRQEPTGPATPLAADLHRMEFAAANEGAAQSGLSFFHLGVTEQNGFLYFRRLDLPDAEARRSSHLERVRALAADHRNIFTHEYLPRILRLQEKVSWVLELTEESCAVDLELGIDAAVEYFRHVMSLPWLVVHGALFEDTVERLRDRFGLSTSEVTDLLFTRSMVTEKRAGLMQMAGLVRSDPELSALFAAHSSDLVVSLRLARTPGGRKLLKLFDAFLATYGLTRRELPLDYRVYSEAPDLLVNEVRSLLGIDPADHARNLAQIEERQAALTDRLTRGLSSKEAEELRDELDFLRASFTVRDDHGHYIDLGAVGYLRFVLVLRHVREINPAAYAGRVAGIVVEDGSPFDHIGIWARECGIPTLFSAEGITELVCDGDLLEIDGVREVARIG